MKKKLLGCILSAFVIMGGTLVLTSPAQAAAMDDGCPRDWISACGSAPPGCYVSGTCTVGPDDKPQIQCSINC